MKFAVWLQMKREKGFLFQKKDQVKTNNTRAYQAAVLCLNEVKCREGKKEGSRIYLGQTSCDREETLRKGSA